MASSFSHSGFFVVRTPLLPLEELVHLAEGGRGQGKGEVVALTEPAPLDGTLRERLHRWSRRPEIVEALLVATPALLGASQTWTGRDDNPKVERALFRYFVRAASRCAPFGLFSGLSVGKFGGEAGVSLQPMRHYRKHARLDASCLHRLAAWAARNPETLANANLRLNPTIYRGGGALRYVATNNSGRTELMVVEETPYLDAVLRVAAAGGSLAEATEAILAVVDGVEGGEVHQFLLELVGASLVFTDLVPATTGLEPPGPHGNERCQAAATGLSSELSRLLAAISAGPIGEGVEIHSELEDRLGRAGVATVGGENVQVDLIKPVASANLPESTAALVLSGVEVANACARTHPGAAGWEAFVQRFVARYADSDVPLLEALDPDLGLGFQAPSTHVASSLIGELPSAPATDSERWLKRDRYLLERLGGLAPGEELKLTDADLAALHNPVQRPLPDAFEAEIAAARPPRGGSIEIHLKSACGPSGARRLGRFCSVDEMLRGCVSTHLAAEEELRPGAIFAEVVYECDSRNGNVARRPLLRSYEIPVLGRSGALPSRQIQLSDLYLRALPDERILLYSRRLGAEVIPRITTAQNPRFAFDVVRFFHAFQEQGVSGYVTWEWGPLGAWPRLPRVSWRNVVLSLQRWNLNREVRRRLHRADVEGRWKQVIQLREEWRLPRFVRLDGELILDLENRMAADALGGLVREHTAAFLTEVFGGIEDQLVSGPEGHFASEFIIPFVRTGPRRKRAPGVEPRIAPRKQFLPGSEWLYAKLYTSPACADRLIREVIAPLASWAKSTGVASRWFFLRYADPDVHLRLRFHGAPDRLMGDLLPELNRRLHPHLLDRTCRQLQLQGYEPEVDRYGGLEGLSLAEEMFMCDSEFACKAISAEAASPHVRWQFALAATDRLFEDFELPLEERISLLRLWGKGLRVQLGAAESDQVAIARRFRLLRSEIEAALENDFIDGARTWLNERSAELRPLASSLRRLKAAGLLTVTETAILGHLAHLQVNRLQSSLPLVHERVLYEFLVRNYASTSRIHFAS